ncbi:hypothetical protein [Hyalangium rubrum]|uniref:Lipoprotein n=1 Tax=Hyalangium rubrum TaxID=3103134 RepID=A0ABU5H3B8_9BACT|nr:hypothetical protein [Hyalangium sp. s54d21]MDY7227617.1 hypothetical protein [Hyalangium sp. s54d21]
MRHSGFRRWMWLGGLGSALVLSVGCGRLPQTGGERPDDPPENFFGGPVRHVPQDFYTHYQVDANRGFNGTIGQLGSSIDPRTPEKLGTQGNSRMEDVTGYMGRGVTTLGGNEAPTSQGIGGGGNAGTTDMGWREHRGNETPAPDWGDYGSKLNK